MLWEAFAVLREVIGGLDRRGRSKYLGKIGCAVETCVIRLLAIRLSP